MIETVIASLISALAALVPQIPGLIDRIRASTSLTDDGRALLDSMEGSIDRHAKYLEERSRPLPVPDPKPTRPDSG